MDEKLALFRDELIQDVKLTSASKKDFNRASFVHSVMDELIKSDELEDFEECYYDGIIGSRKKRVEIDGYDYDEYDGTFTVVACIYDGTKNSKIKITKTDIEQLAERARRFIEGSLDETVQDSIEESEPAFELAQFIESKRDEIQRYRIIIISDLEKSDRIKILDVGEIESKKVMLKLWDIENLYELSIANSGFDDIEIRMEDFGINGLPCIRACERKDGLDYDAYLCAIPGTVLASIYEKYGNRVMESNVRSFLKLTTKTNKSIRATILKEPEKFFAYNNGITTTATEIDTSESNGMMIIKGFTSLQIVNGGQTTVTLYTVGKSRDNPDMSGIFVPMKISVISREDAEDMVPKISRSANTQNKVSESDFFSNSQFHKTMQDYSRRIRAPLVSGMPYATRWYYERTRGQYQQEINLKSSSEASKFKLENPKNQVFTKTDLAKYRNSYAQKPHIVSKGAQYSLIEFAGDIDEEHMEKYNELYFKESVALGILFKHIQGMVSDQPWYNGGYRAQIVTYSMAKLFSMIENRGAALDLMKIWEMQKIPEAIERQLIDIMSYVNESITTDKEEENVGQWCKKLRCWEKIKAINISEYPGITSYYIRKGEERYERKAARRDQRNIDLMNALIDVVNYGSEFWKNTYVWGVEHDCLTGYQRDILRTAFDIQSKRPSDKQARQMMLILKQLREDGYPN